MNDYQFIAPTKVLFGQGQLRNLHTLAMPGKKALIVISNGKSTITNGSLATLKEELETAECPYEIFNKIGPNPLKEAIEEGAQFALDQGCDFFIALGGGSVMDATKIMAMLASQPTGDLWDYVFTAHGKKQKLVNPVMPWIAITTSAGTGSEVDSVGVATNLATNEKIGIGNPQMFATYAIVDPDLMKTVPPKFTAYQGFDALFHSLEGYISNMHNPMGDMVQRAAIENIGRYLARAVADGNDMEARTGVAFANTMSGYSMVTTTCISEHAMEHAMSAFHPELPHGAGLIMISEEYFKYWVGRHVCDDRFVDLARFLGKEDATEAADFLVAFRSLLEACGVANLKMSDYGIEKSEIPAMVQNAMDAKRLFLKDPVLMSAEDCAAIYEASYR